MTENANFGKAERCPSCAYVLLSIQVESLRRESGTLLIECPKCDTGFLPGLPKEE